MPVEWTADDEFVVDGITYNCTALFAQVAHADKLLAIDLMSDPCAPLEDFLDERQYRGLVG